MQTQTLNQRLPIADVRSPPSMQDCEESKDLNSDVMSSPGVILVDKIGTHSSAKKKENLSPVSKLQLEGKKCSLFDPSTVDVIPETPEEKILQIISEFTPGIFK